jgi:hypothetical protein
MKHLIVFLAFFQLVFLNACTTNHNLNHNTKPATMSDSSIRGIYKHYKGNLYEVMGTAIHSETREVVVVYRALYGEYLLFVRPKTMFFETVTINGQTKPRFELIQKIE